MRVTIFFAALLTGCATQFPADTRTPEQIAASAKDKGAEIECFFITSVYGTARRAKGSVDKSALGTGGGVVSADPETCKLMIQITPKAASGVP